MAKLTNEDIEDIELFNARKNEPNLTTDEFKRLDTNDDNKHKRRRARAMRVDEDEAEGIRHARYMAYGDIEYEGTLD